MSRRLADEMEDSVDWAALKDRDAKARAIDAASRAATQRARPSAAAEEDDGQEDQDLAIEQLNENKRKLIDIIEEDLESKKEQLVGVAPFTLIAEFKAFNFLKPQRMHLALLSIEVKPQQFVFYSPVPCIRIDVDPAQISGRRCTVTDRKGAVEVARKQISTKKIYNFTRLEDTRQIAGMCSKSQRCYYEPRKGKFLTLSDPVEFILSEQEEKEENERRAKIEEEEEMATFKRRKAGNYEKIESKFKSLKKLTNRPFFTEKFKCLQNASHIRVYGPYDARFTEKTVYLTLNVRNERGKGDKVALGLHMLGKNQVVLVTQSENGFVNVYTINVDTREVTTQLQLIEADKSQIVKFIDGPSLFLLGNREISQFLFEEKGFVLLDKLKLKVPKLTGDSECFYVSTSGKICVGFIHWVVFYDLRNAEARDEKSSVLKYSRYVTCDYPEEIMLVEPKSTSELLLSYRGGVELWTRM